MSRTQNLGVGPGPVQPQHQAPACPSPKLATMPSGLQSDRDSGVMCPGDSPSTDLTPHEKVQAMAEHFAIPTPLSTPFVTDEGIHVRCTL